MGLQSHKKKGKGAIFWEKKNRLKLESHESPKKRTLKHFVQLHRNHPKRLVLETKSRLSKSWHLQLLQEDALAMPRSERHLLQVVSEDKIRLRNSENGISLRNCLVQVAIHPTNMRENVDMADNTEHVNVFAQ